VSAALAIIRDADTAGAMLSPVRRQVLTALREPGSATTVGTDLGMPRQKVNYHLRALETLGLLEHVEDRRRGNCTERIVRATASHYLIDSSLLGDLGASPADAADRFSSDHLAAVASRTLSDVAELQVRARRAGKRLPTLSLETAIRFASPERQTEFVESLSNAVAELVARYHDEAAPEGRWFRVTLASHPALARTEAGPNSPNEDISGENP
jgi:DNA-binding transcriptional ArsR family regulator